MYSGWIAIDELKRIRINFTSIELKGDSIIVSGNGTSLPLENDENPRKMIMRILGHPIQFINWTSSSFIETKFNFTGLIQIQLKSELNDILTNLVRFPYDVSGLIRNNNLFLYHISYNNTYVSFNEEDSPIVIGWVEFNGSISNDYFIFQTPSETHMNAYLLNLRDGETRIMITPDSWFTQSVLRGRLTRNSSPQAALRSVSTYLRLHGAKLYENVTIEGRNGPRIQQFTAPLQNLTSIDLYHPSLIGIRRGFTPFSAALLLGLLCVALILFLISIRNKIHLL